MKSMLMDAHLVSPAVPSRIFLTGEKLNPWRVADMFNHGAHTLRLSAMLSLFLDEGGLALTAFAMLVQLIGQSLLGGGEQAMLRQTAIVLPKTHPVLDPCDGGNVLKTPLVKKP